MSETGLSFNWAMKEPDDVEGRDGYDICTDDEYPDILASGLGRDEAQFILSGIAALRTLSAINPDAPVKVAEALPELVEAAKGIQDYFDDVDAAVSRGEKVYVGRDYPDMQSRETFKRALAKLKAQP